MFELDEAPQTTEPISKTMIEARKVSFTGRRV